MSPERTDCECDSVLHCMLTAYMCSFGSRKCAVHSVVYQLSSQSCVPVQALAGSVNQVPKEDPLLSQEVKCENATVL